MGLRFWIGMWSTLLLLLIVVFDMSSYVRYITRFTEESFAALISIIFIYEAFKQLFEIPEGLRADLVSNRLGKSRADELGSNAINMKELLNYSESNKTAIFNVTVVSGNLIRSNKIDEKTVNEVFFFSIILFILTFLIAYGLQEFKQSRFLPIKVFLIFCF